MIVLTLEYPFDAPGKVSQDFWLGLSRSLESQFPYLSFETTLNTYSLNLSRDFTVGTDVHTVEPDLLKRLNPEVAPRSDDRYNYDMTLYIRDPKLRLRDSATMAKIFDQEFDAWISDPSHRSLDYVDVPFADTFHGSRRCLQFLKTPEEIFKYYFTIAQIEAPHCIDKMLKTSLQFVIPFFSHIKVFIHTHIDELPPISYCYSELDTIAGYPLQSHRSLNDSAHTWLTQDVPDLHSASWWANEIFTVLMQYQVPPSEALMTFYQFIQSPWLWVTNGASSLSRMTLNGKKVRTKFGAAMSLTTAELLQCVLHALNPRSHNIDIFIKPDERGFKRRLIANMDLGSYLVAAYIRYLLEWLDGPTPHWMTATTNPPKDLFVIQQLQSACKAMPLDESQFDHHLSRAAWLGFLKSLDHIFPHNFGVHLFHVLFANSNYFDRESKLTGPWFKGMPSGLAITAIGNTLFNYVKQIAIISPIHYALGDDVLVFGDGYSLSQISEYYTTFGAELNPKKNWTSHHYAEYLHFLYARHGRVGLPARIYGSLIYGLQFKDVTPLQRLNELSMLFKDFYDRAVLPFNFRLVAADLSRAVSRRWAGFSTQVALDWLHIPKALNGFGFLPYSPHQMQVDNTKVKRIPYQNTLYDIPPQLVVLQSTYKILPFKLNDAQFHVGNVYHLPKIQSIADWIDRLNFRTPGVSATVQMWATSVIPLPEIDFVSTSRMSSFAQMWKYNAFPNCSGSALSRTTRFIKASLALAEDVQNWLRQNRIVVYV